MRRQRHPRVFLLILVAGISAFGGLWYLSADESPAAKPAVGGVYVEGTAGMAVRVNPLFASYNSTDASLSALVFAGLTRLDDRGRPFPDLAESWTVSDDGMVYSFRLRPGLLWQDGSPLTAADVVFTYDLLRQPDLPTLDPLAPLLAGADIEATDERTLIVTLPQPYAPLPSYLTLGILPRHLLAEVPAESLFDHEFNRRPVGSGPFRLEQISDASAVLSANPFYHFGQPFISRFEMRFFPDERALVLALEKGEVDGALLRTGLEKDESLRLQDNQGLVISRLGTGDVTGVYLNLEKPLFQDVRLRRALMFALDRDSIADVVFGGVAVPAQSFLPASVWGSEPVLDEYDADLEIAGRLLDDAGWRLNGAGERERDGERLAFALTTNQDPVLIAVATRLAESWRLLGIAVSVENTGGTSLLRELVEPRAFDAVVFTLVTGPAPDPYRSWHSSQIDSDGANIASWRNDEADALLEQARQAPSRGIRDELYRRFQELFAREVPSLPLYEQSALYVQTSRLHDVRAGYLPDPGARFWQVQEWFLEAP